MNLKLSPEKVFNTQNLIHIGEFIKEYFPDEVSHVTRIANDVCQNTFLFDRPWDMEPTIHPITFQKEINWEFIPEEDDEWIFMLARHGYTSQLGEAYSLTQDEKYPKAFVRLVSNFIDHAKLTSTSIRTTWRTIDSSIRVENWIKGYIHMHTSPYFTSDFLEKFLTSLLEHGDYLYRTHDSFRTISNWGVIQNQGLLALGAFLSEQELGQKYMEIALHRLTEHATLQVMDDGTHWEQSPMYHNEVLHSFQNVVSITRRCNLNISPIIEEKTYKMCYTNLNWAKPNHHQVSQGDSDDTDIRDMISRGAYLFSDPTLKFGGFKVLDPISCWYEGLEAINSYNRLNTLAPSYTHAILQTSGNYYLRDSWKEDANYLHFHCGSLGSGHGHANLLHIDLFAQGEDILVDSGRFTYIHKPIRTDFKSAFAHNTTIVDGKSFTECTESWDFGKIANYVQSHFVDKGLFSMAEGSHLGYMHLENGGIFTNRKIIYIKPDIYVVIDTFTGMGTHTYDQLFHFNNQGQVTTKGTSVAYESNKVKATVCCITPDVTLTTYDSLLSRKYNALENNKSIKYSLTHTGDTSLITVIHTQSIEDTTPLSCKKIPVTSMTHQTVFSAEYAEALKIQKGTNEYTILIAHKDFFGGVDMALANGLKGYGKVRAWDAKGQLTVLSW
ncbi:MAG: alginate lyase family protein [Zhenhengia sp.]|uniref:alginate lyase family protein n=1 Tax=Zhenhengia sp. TaxID=2944208 RepID=UPI00290FC44E|nr:alginate lyase family protein [Clostridiales bacterium]MDU6973543.1 alginate lyase family protein [Clostridiales bacterium]